MIFTYYIDESGTHEKEPTISMGGFLGHAYQWRQFEKKLKAIQEKYGFKILHAADLKGKRGEFKGWTGKKCMDLIHEITALVEDNLTEGSVVGLPFKNYKEGYKDTPNPEGVQADTQYGLCFRACMANVVPRVAASGKSPQLHIVIEDGHKHVGDTKRIFDQIKKIHEEAGDPILGTITLAKKAEAPPLMVADFLVHTYAIMNESDNPEWKQGLSPIPPKKKKGKASLVYLEITAESLPKLKANHAKIKEFRTKNWQERNAKKAKKK